MMKFIRYIILVFLLLVILVGSFLGFLSTTAGEKILLSFIVTNVNKRIDHTIAVERLETNLLTRIELKDVIIKSFSGENREFLTLNSISADYRLTDLLKNKITINSIHLDSLNVSLEHDSAGRIILPRLVSAKETVPKSKSAFGLNLSSLVIKNSSVRYNNETMELAGKAEKLNFQIKEQERMEYAVDADIGAIEGKYKDSDITLRNFSVQGILSEEHVKLTAINLNLPGMSLSGKAEAALADSAFPVNADFLIEGKIDSLTRIFENYIPEKIAPLSGIITVALNISADKEKRVIRAEIRSPELLAKDIELKNIDLIATAQNDSMILNKIKLNVMKGEVDGYGFVYLDSLFTHKFSLGLKDFKIENLNRIVSADTGLYSGKLNGRLTSEGSLRSPESLKADFDLTVSDIHYQGKNIAPLTVFALASKGIINLNLKQENNRAVSTVYVTGDKIKGNFSAEIGNIEPITGLINIKAEGSLSLNGGLSGNWKSPDITASLNGKNIKYMNIKLDNMIGRVRRINSELFVESGSFSGEIPEISELQLPFDLSKFGGGVKYQGSVSGRVEELSGELQLDLLNPAFDEYRFDSGIVMLKANNNIIDIGELSLSSGMFTVSGDGSYIVKSASGEFRLELSGNDDTPPETTAGLIKASFNHSDKENIRLEAETENLALSTLSDLLNFDQNLTGKLDFILNFSGNPEHPNAGVVFLLRDAVYNNARIDSARGSISIADDLVTIDSLRTYYRNDSLRADLTLKLSRDAQNRLAFTKNDLITARIRTEGFDLSVFEEIINAAEIRGFLRSDLRFTGSLKDPHAVGIIEIFNGKLSLSEKSPPMDNLQMLITMVDTTFLVDNLSGNAGGKQFTLSGKISSSDFQRYHSEFNLYSTIGRILSGKGIIARNYADFQIETSGFDLALLQGINPILSSLQGKMNASIIIRGEFSQPEITGKVNIDSLSYRSDYLDAPFTAGIVKISFNGFHVQLDTLHTSYKTGYIALNGYADIAEKKFSKFKLNARASGLNFKKIKEYNINLKSSTLTCELTNDKYQLDGDVVLGESRIVHRFPPEKLLTVFQKSDKQSPVLPEILQKTTFNIRVRESDDIWIDNNLAKLRLHSELALTGNPIQPNINGRLSIIEGYVYYLDRKFTVNTGIMDFIDPVKPIPYVNLSAETTVRDYQSSQNDAYKITLNITGPLNKPEITLLSEPPLGRSDILSLLTLGITRDKSAGNGSAGSATFSDVMKERLGETSTRQISGYISKKAESALGLSQFSVEGNLFNINNKTGPQLVASRKISKRIELTYVTTIGYMNTQGIRLDYLLNKHFSFEGQTDQKGDSGIDFKYRIKF